MKRTLQILGALFVVQAALAVGLNYHQASDKSGPAASLLVTAAKKDIDHLTIEDSGGVKTVLVKSATGWELPDQGNFPADQAKVDGLLDKLLSIREGLPVATSDGSLERFSLTGKKFERRITFGSGGAVLTTLYLGTQQGANQIHARRDDQDGVYTVDFASYQAPALIDDWINATLLSRPLDTIADIDVAGLTLHHDLPESVAKASDATANATATATATAATSSPQATPVGWQLVNPGDGQTLAADKAEILANRLAGLRIASVLGTDAHADYGLDAPLATIVLHPVKGDAVTYQLGKMTSKDDYVLKASDHPEYFRLGNYSGKQLADAAMAKTLLADANADAKADVKTGQDGVGKQDNASPSPTH